MKCRVPTHVAVPLGTCPWCAGLRVHPEFLPRMDPCDDNWNNDPDADGPFTQVGCVRVCACLHVYGVRGAWRV